MSRDRWSLWTVAATLLAGLVFVLVVISSPGPVSPPSPSGNPGASSDSLDSADYRPSVPRDAIQPIYDPTFLPADEAALHPDELVIGVRIHGQARAYPVGYLNFREMVNDRIGTVPFLVTW